MTERVTPYTLTTDLLREGARAGYLNHTEDCAGALSMVPKVECTCGLAQWIDRLIAVATL